MSRLKESFTVDRKALLAYIVAGDPDKGTTVGLMHSMVEAGVDGIELGVPFSDPEAEGPVIQLAHERALAHKTSLNDCFEMVRKFRQDNQHTPIILMGYLNPIESMGYDVFSDKAASSGVDAMIIVNLPPEEAPVLSESLKRNKVDLVYLLAPTTTDQRAEMICTKSSGFVYYVSLKGTTGAGTIDVSDVAIKLERFRSMSTLPVLVGFGIKDGDTAGAVGANADGVVVGSAIVDRMANADSSQINQEVCTLLAEIRQALDELSS